MNGTSLNSMVRLAQSLGMGFGGGWWAVAGYW
jgi:hypothetical protein